MQVHRFTPTLFSSNSSQDLCQAVGVIDPKDVNVVLTAESLNQREVDLQGYVFNVVLISGQDAQNHIVRVSVEKNMLQSGGNI